MAPHQPYVISQEEDTLTEENARPANNTQAKTATQSIMQECALAIMEPPNQSQETHQDQITGVCWSYHGWGNRSIFRVQITQQTSKIQKYMATLLKK